MLQPSGSQGFSSPAPQILTVTLVSDEPWSPPARPLPSGTPSVPVPGGLGWGQVRGWELPQSGPGVPGSAWVCAGRAVYPVWQRV